MEKKHDDGKPMLVTELGLSTRVTHLLQRNGIHSVAILERMGDESLMLLRGMGPGMFAEIRSKVPRPKKSDAEELAAYRATGLTPEEISSVRSNPLSNADRIRSLSDEELAAFLVRIAYGRETPWCDLFAENFCRKCPTTTCTVEGYFNPMDLHECDFKDGECPHGSDIVWWLKQPMENE